MKSLLCDLSRSVPAIRLLRRWHLIASRNIQWTVGNKIPVSCTDVFMWPHYFIRDYLIIYDGRCIHQDQYSIHIFQTLRNSSTRKAFQLPAPPFHVEYLWKIQLYSMFHVAISHSKWPKKLISSTLVLAFWYNRSEFQTLYKVKNKWTPVHKTGCCSTRHHSKTLLKIKCREISITPNLLLGCQIVSKNCTKQGQMIWQQKNMLTI